MKQFTEEEIKALAKQHMFSLTDEQVESCAQSSAVFLKQIEYLYLIDTEDVEPMDMPFETITEWMRDDVVDHTMNRDVLLDNAPLTKDEFIEIVKVLV